MDELNKLFFWRPVTEFIIQELGGDLHKLLKWMGCFKGNDLINNLEGNNMKKDREEKEEEEEKVEEKAEEKEEETEEKPKKSREKWIVTDVPTQFEPAVVDSKKDEVYTIHTALAKILNNQEKIMDGL